MHHRADAGTQRTYHNTHFNDTTLGSRVVAVVVTAVAIVTKEPNAVGVFFSLEINKTERRKEQAADYERIKMRESMTNIMQITSSIVYCFQNLGGRYFMILKTQRFRLKV